MLQMLAILITRPRQGTDFSILCRPRFDSIVVDDRIFGPKRTLRGLKQVTAAGIEQLRKARPELAIHFTEPNSHQPPYTISSMLRWSFWPAANVRSKERVDEWSYSGGSDLPLRR